MITSLYTFWTRMTRWWAGLNRQYRVALAGGVAIVFITLVTLLAVFVMSRLGLDVWLPVFGPDPWPAAIEQAQHTLDTSPDFERHLQSYRSVPSEIDSYLSLVERARFASTAFDDLQKLSLPLLGNAWLFLVDVLNAVIPGSGSGLLGLDDTLHQVLALRGRLVSLGDTEAVVAAIQEFRENPSRKTLVEMRNAMEQYGDVLVQADKDLQPHLATIDNAVERVDRIQQGIQRTQDTLGRIPLLPDAVGRLNQVISDLFGPLYNLQKALSDLHTRIQADLATMSTIRDIVAAAEHR